MKRAPHVVIVCQLFYPELVSTGQTVTELAESLVEKDCQVSVICGPMTVVTQDTAIPNQLTYKGIHIHRVWGTRFSKLSFWGKLANHLSFAHSVFWHLLFQNLCNKRLLVLTNPPFLGWIVAALSHLKKLSFDYLLFDLYPETAVQCKVLQPNSMITRLWHRLNQWVYHRATTLLVIGRCMDQRLRQQLSPKDQGKIRLLPMWCDTNLLSQNLPSKSDNPYRQRWANDASFLISYSGNMARFHDIQSILMTAKALGKTHPQIRFCFIGEGYRKQEVVDYVAQHALKNCTIDTYVPRDDLALALAAADAGIVSLLPGHEGLSVPSKTYGIMAVGNPIIGLLPEASEIAMMISELPCGIVCKPYDWESFKEAVITVYEDAEKRLSLGQAGQQAIQENYHVGHATDRYKHWLADTKTTPQTKEHEQ